MFFAMNGDRKKACAETPAQVTKSSGATPPLEGFPLPETIILNEILRRVELQSLCSLACVSRDFRSMVSQALSALPSLDLSVFSPTGEILGNIVPRLRRVKNITIDCLHLDDSSIINIIGPHIQELNLLKCSSLSYSVLPSVGEKCPNLRILVLELAGERSAKIFEKALVEMLTRFLCLEYLTIKVRQTTVDASSIGPIGPFLPKTLESLKLQSVTEQDAIQLIEELRRERGLRNSVDSKAPSNLGFSGFTLLRLSLVLDVISDRLITLIASSLLLLVELDLEDRPSTEPIHFDLTNNGLQILGSCKHLTSLSIVRSRLNCFASFERINDLGVMLLSESCGGLESVRLGSFSRVTDAGFSSLLRSCANLKKFEVRNAPLLSDLAFHNIVGAACPLVELKLLSCNLISSEAVAELSSSSTMEVLDTYGCRSIADPCLEYISCLHTLTSLNLRGADITDSGLSVLSKGDLPIISLGLRGCTRVTDRGIICLLNDGQRIKKTLSSLDVGHIPGITDRAIHAIVTSAESITELCMRSCFFVTDASFKILAAGRSDGGYLLQKLDICLCIRFSAGMVELLEQPFFRGLKWLGVGSTSLVNKRDDFAVISRKRPWLTVCFESCEVGCHDGWQFHYM